MELTHFTPGPDSQRPAGPCTLGGRAAFCAVDRSDPALAWVTLSFGTGPAPLPEFALQVSEISVAGIPVPVQPVKLEDGSGALQGSVDPALAGDFLALPPVSGEARPAPEAHAPETPAPPAPANLAAGPADGDDAVFAKVEAYRAAKAAHAEGLARVAPLRKAERRLRRELEDAAEEREELEASLPALETAVADARRQLRETLDREEA